MLDPDFSIAVGLAYHCTGKECFRYLQEESENNTERVSLIIVKGIQSLKQNSVIIDRDYWLKVRIPEPLLLHVCQCCLPSLIKALCSPCQSLPGESLNTTCSADEFHA